jgi:hypothetical protein
VICVLAQNKRVVTQQFGIHGQHWFHFFTIMYLLNNLPQKKAWKGVVHMTLYFSVLYFIDHAMYDITQNKALKRCVTHGLNIKWKCKAWSCLLDYGRLAGSVALRQCRAHPGVEDSLLGLINNKEAWVPINIEIMKELSKWLGGVIRGIMRRHGSRCNPFLGPFNKLQVEI